METAVPSKSGLARARAPLSPLSNSRVNMIANQAPPARFTRDENANPYGSAPLDDQVQEFLAAPTRTINEIILAFLVRPDEFVIALLDTFELGIRQEPIPWSSPLIQLFVYSFGWKITNVVACYENGELDMIVVQRPSRAAEERARVRSQASYIRGVNPPVPRTYYEARIKWLLSQDDQEDIVYELRNAPVFIVGLMLEQLRKKAMSEQFLYWGPVTRVLLDEFDWTIVGGSVYADAGNEGDAGWVAIAPPAKPNRRRRVD